ncbi:hypothetical protein AN957_13720 [Cytobacillus solani]|uniref:Lipoprotein n=2 Tax=Cytobacillus solani TaxID=1637975 RepID=A0A0Q3QN08_9BACI|nr:hypothetical protein AMS60_08450 [Bacillus sp. FJAT-21945]KQL19513.1 hypothetical protein AN957_13720 [Cytobacillus solani]
MITRRIIMKKLNLLIAVLVSLMLSGCSFLGEVNDSLDYANKATDHINTLSNFAETAPQMIQDAATNGEAKEELENQLKTLIEKMEKFNAIDPPSIAEDIHQQLVEKNEIIIEEMNQVMADGEILLDKIESTEIFTTINEITTLLNQLKELGL